jgi:hypothetical protein
MLIGFFLFFWAFTSPFFVPFGMVPWTPHSSVDNGQCLIPGLVERERESARHDLCPSLCYFLPLGNTWGLFGTAKVYSPSPLFLNRPHYLQMLKGIKWKRKPCGHQACARLVRGFKAWVHFSVLYEPHTTTWAR